MGAVDSTPNVNAGFTAAGIGGSLITGTPPEDLANNL